MTNANDKYGTAPLPMTSPDERDTTVPADQSPTLPLSVVRHGQGERKPTLPPRPVTTAVLDLGDKDCGDGPLEEVARALYTLPPGAYLEVRTSDEDVAIALFAWCRLLGYAVTHPNPDRFVLAAAPRQTAPTSYHEQ